MPDDPYDLDRFVEAQEPVIAAALAELRRGRKESHWMWFVFPQIAGLGRSPTAKLYAIRSLAEARAYLAHPVLGARLREGVALLLGIEGRGATAILGPVDAAKLRSCLTLFAAADPDEALFPAALAKYFGGQPDPLKMQHLHGAA
jgi:uncharacterized protein (DUF1810 family)